MTDTETETTTSKRAVAKHFMLDAAGVVTEDETLAKGIRYTHLATGRTFDYMLKDGPSKDMLAIFGAKTLATNEASAMRQKEGDNSDQVGAIEERFALIDTGQWVDRTREGGPRTDRDALALAAAEIFGEAQSPAWDEAQVAAQAKVLRDKIEADPKLITFLGKVTGVSARYAQKVGKATKSVSELADLMKVTE
jgi:hypothetical protein